ncbi:hypothetical protein BT67DRAFT_62332 [Trichocladium antarcticum]|uniref:Chromo domain-containing protein n=1 Tax=Trichocladium antarcticum TaxID=1450529 RepID=A0AAN6ZCZ7_9PEZI|nr:hypothetical protein BT67DRAFT_62332 [Trichocladium antarcticum]
MTTMFKTNPKTPFAAISLDDSESDDNISLTSSLSDHHDPDEEYEVECILAEEPNDEDGMRYYLVKWTGFPLHQCTWEPETELGDDLRKSWEATRAKHAAGELEPFDIRKFHAARDREDEAKAARHRRRNAKRNRLGQPLTPPFLDNTNSSEDEAVEDGCVEVLAQGPAASRAPIRSRGIPDSRGPTAPALPSGTSANGSSSRPQTETRRPSITTETASSTKKAQAARLRSTGYHGTARKPSKPSADAALKRKTGPVSHTMGAAPSSVKPAGVQKPLKAKKSVIQPTGNIFTGGKTRKPRPGLKDAMSDPTKEQKFFGKHRQRRLAEKQSRDMEDVAPDISKMRLLNITTLAREPAANRRSSATSIQSPILHTSPQEYISTAELPSMAAAASPTSTLPTPNVAGPAAGPPKKKRKSVRFLEADEPAVMFQEPEPMDTPMDVDNTAPTDDSTSLLLEPSQNPHPTPAPKKLSLDRPMARIQGSQNSNKKLAVGRTSVEVVFNDLPREPPGEHAWLADFLAKDALEFQHTCLAQTLASQIGALVQCHLASGTVVAKAGESGLDRVATYLSSGLLGLHYGQTEYNVLVYPTKCEEWKSIPLGQGATSPSEVALQYTIFRSHQDCGRMLPPLPPLLASRPLVKDPNPKVEDKGAATSDRALMMKRMFGLDYSKLLPGRPEVLPIHKFFLMAPESRGAAIEALAHWLHASNPHCQIYASYRPGSWAAFQACAGPGVVIIHEALAWSLRLIPNLSRHLISRNDEYWSLSEPLHSLPLYPSISPPEDTAPPGDIRLTRLFPYRTAILLTPSFLVSEPRRAVEFLNWFLLKWASGFHYRVVTAWNIHEYLLEVADEKYKARQALWDRPGDTQPEIAADLRDLSDEDCRIRYQAADLASELHIMRTCTAGQYAHDEANSSLVYADSTIDPNDEQSLVNWFGWWTILQADQFRKLHVVGSSEAIKLHGSRKGERRVRIPRYSQVTLNDPEAVMEVFRERDDQVDQVDEAKPKAHIDDTSAQVPAQVPDKGGGRRSSHDKHTQSDLVRLSDISSIIGYLEEVGSQPGSGYQWILYKFPISWLDLEMAEHFDDFKASYHRISDWLKFSWPFGRKNYNTYVGFFYTIAEDWNPPEDVPPKTRTPERHPWIAVYRPVNPHLKPYGRCEVIIWDPAARTKFAAKQTPSEKDLFFMQRQVIQHIRDHGDQKNPNTWLDRVWLGGFDWPSDCDSTRVLGFREPARRGSGVGSLGKGIWRGRLLRVKVVHAEPVLRRPTGAGYAGAA